MRVDVLARVDRATRETDNLSVAPHRRTRIDAAYRELVTRGNQPATGKAGPNPHARNKLQPCNHDVVIRMQAHDRLSARQRIDSRSGRCLFSLERHDVVSDRGTVPSATHPLRV